MDAYRRGFAEPERCRVLAHGTRAITASAPNDTPSGLGFSTVLDKLHLVLTMTWSQAVLMKLFRDR